MQASYHKICTHVGNTHTHLNTHRRRHHTKVFNTTHLHIFNNNFARKLKNGQT